MGARFTLVVALALAGCLPKPRGGCDCAADETCKDGACQPRCNVADGCIPCATLADCDDGDACTDAVCQDGACSFSPHSCDDGNVCTDDTCNPQSGCQNVNNTGPCDDGVSCTLTDTCSDGACSGTPTDAACDDSNVCTDDRCDAVLDCQHVNNNAACDDTVGCTENDICSDGVCGGTANDALCNDDNMCTNDSCDAKLDCQHLANSDPCDDGNGCTDTDTCSEGVCSGNAALANFRACDDGKIATTPDFCYGGACLTGSLSDVTSGELGCSCPGCGVATAAGLEAVAGAFQAAINSSWQKNPSDCKSAALTSTGLFSVTPTGMSLIGNQQDGSATALDGGYLVGSGNTGEVLLGMWSGSAVSFSGTPLHSALTSLDAASLTAVDAVCLGPLPCTTPTDVWLAGTISDGSALLAHCDAAGCGNNLVAASSTTPAGVSVLTASTAGCTPPCTEEQTYSGAIMVARFGASDSVRYVNAQGAETLDGPTTLSGAQLNGVIMRRANQAILYGDNGALYSCLYAAASGTWTCSDPFSAFMPANADFVDAAHNRSGDLLLLAREYNVSDNTITNVIYALPAGGNYTAQSAWVRLPLLGGRVSICLSGDCDERLARHIAVLDDDVTVIGDNLTQTDGSDSGVALWRFDP